MAIATLYAKSPTGHEGAGKAGSSEGSNPKALMYYSPADMCCIKVSVGKEPEKSSMQPGPAGFWVGTFSDGSRFATEVPNIQTPGPVSADAKALAMAKGKAKGKAKAKAEPKAHGA
eukprot:11002042-Alexandrium_andersonii.AAC.1